MIMHITEMPLHSWFFIKEFLLLKRISLSLIRHTRFLSWSMAKSFTNALVGILVRQGRIDINKPAGLEQWKNDERSKITLNDLMQMQSGLEWNEDYGNRSDVTLMLHCESDMGRLCL